MYSQRAPSVCCFHRGLPPTQATSSPGNPACFWSQGGSILKAPASIPPASDPGNIGWEWRTS